MDCNSRASESFLVIWPRYALSGSPGTTALAQFCRDTWSVNITKNIVSFHHWITNSIVLNGPNKPHASRELEPWIMLSSKLDMSSGVRPNVHVSNNEQVLFHCCLPMPVIMPLFLCELLRPGLFWAFFKWSLSHHHHFIERLQWTCKSFEIWRLISLSNTRRT